MAAALLLIIFAILNARLPMPVSGSDGGNWLMLSGGLLGIDANAASTVYPPAFLVLLALIRIVAPPLEALHLAAALVVLLPGLGCYLLLRSLGLGAIALTGLAFSLIGYSSEMLAWGGYPQLMGTGLAMIACASLVYGYRDGSDRYFAAAGACAGLALLTHQLAGPQAVIIVGIVAVGALFTQIRQWRTWIRQHALLAGVFAIVVLPLVPIYINLVQRTGPAAFNSAGYVSFADVVNQLTYDAPTLWRLLAICIPVAAVLRAMRGAWLDVVVLGALLVASLGVAAVTFEVRALYVGLLLGFVASGLLVAELLRLRGRGWRMGLAAAAVAVLLALIVAGQQRLDSSSRYYAMLDPFMVEGLQWIRAHARPDDLAVAAQSREKWPLGWWVQGLGQVPTYVEHDPRLLFFQEEKCQAEVARRILAYADPQEAAAESQRYGVTLLIFDVRDSGQLDNWLHSGRVHGPIGLAYSSPSLAVLRVDTASRTTPASNVCAV